MERSALTLGIPLFCIPLLISSIVNRYIVTLKYPEILPVMQKAINEQTRKAMEFADSSQCMTENVPLLEEIIKLRHRMAAHLLC